MRAITARGVEAKLSLSQDRGRQSADAAVSVALPTTQGKVRARGTCLHLHPKGCMAEVLDS